MAKKIRQTRPRRPRRGITEQVRFSVLSSFADQIRTAAASRNITPQMWLLWACEEGLRVPDEQATRSNPSQLSSAPQHAGLS